MSDENEKSEVKPRPRWISRRRPIYVGDNFESHDGLVNELAEQGYTLRFDYPCDPGFRLLRFERVYDPTGLSGENPTKVKP